jgi:hypothetical protein
MRLPVWLAVHLTAMDTEAQDPKVRENRLRRAAVRQGLFLSRRRRRDEQSRDFGHYALLRGGANGSPAYGVDVDGFFTLNIDQVEAILAAGAAPKEPEAAPAGRPAQQHPQPPLVRPRRSLGGRTSRRGR